MVAIRFGQTFEKRCWYGQKGPKFDAWSQTETRLLDPKGSAGVTLIELIIAMAILAILMSGILPLSYMTYKRSREIELRQNLRIIRNALDEYKKQVDEGRIPKATEDSGYPPNLEILVEGVESADAVPVILKFLRRIPRDPMTDGGEWGLRAYADEPGSGIWRAKLAFKALGVWINPRLLGPSKRMS